MGNGQQVLAASPQRDGGGVVGPVELARELGMRYLVRGVWWHRGYSDASERFARLFGEAWELLPLGVRRRLRRYWRERPTPYQVVTPEVRVATDWPGRTPGTLGEVRRRGCLVWFHFAAGRLLPDRPLMGLILHELAHCYGYAESLDGHRPDSDRDVAEDCVCDMLDCWGVIDYQEEQERWLALDASAEEQSMLAG